mgnify:CR=1 FL=1
MKNIRNEPIALNKKAINGKYLGNGITISFLKRSIDIARKDIDVSPHDSGERRFEGGERGIAIAWT